VFSLAEMMVVLLILSIILAATMPILSKRAKYKASTAASGSKVCSKVLMSGSISDVSIGTGIIFYQMLGGGGGGNINDLGWGGGGGSSAIVIDGVVSAFAAGGAGAIFFDEVTMIPVLAQNGTSASGTIFIDNVSNNHTLSAYVGGGGGAGGFFRGFSSSYYYGSGGRGGAGYCAGSDGSSWTSSRTSSTGAPGGSDICATHPYAGNTAVNNPFSLSGGLGGGGGGYGGKGGDAGHYEDSPVINIPATAGTTGSGTGVAGKRTGSGITEQATGGDGGYVKLYFMTNGSSCPNW
jgi:hypothetical protein